MKIKTYFLIISLLLIFSSVEAQISILKDIRKGKQGADPVVLLKFNSKIIFKANDGVNGVELWISDGTKFGTFLLSDISPGSKSTFFGNNFAELNGKFYFIADDGIHGNELWESDGTREGTKLVLDLNDQASGSIDPFSLVKVENELTFLGNDGTSGMQIWKSDGSKSGTQKITDLKNGMLFKVLDKINGNYIFQFNDGVSSRELWTSDGNIASAKILKDINVGNQSSLIANFIRYNDQLIFSAYDSLHGFELWRTNGTSSGTLLIKDIEQDSFGSYPLGFNIFNHKVIFHTIDKDSFNQVWISDGTDTGTKPFLKSKHPLKIKKSYVYGSGLYFEASDPIHGYELFFRDNSDSIQILMDVFSGASSSNSKNVIEVGDKIYFTGTDQNGWNSIWTSKGSSATTMLYNQVNNENGRQISEMNSLNDHIIFKVYTDSSGLELFTNNPLVSIDDVLDLNLSIELFPVPSDGKLFVRSDEKIEIVHVISSDGKGLLTLKPEHQSNLLNLDLGNLASGLYTIEITTINHVVVQKKIIVNN